MLGCLNTLEGNFITNQHWRHKMQLARFLNKVFKRGGFVLTDANSKDYIIGQPNNNPIKLKILNKIFIINYYFILIYILVRHILMVKL